MSPPAGTVLDRILAETREAVERRKFADPVAAPNRGPRGPGRPFRDALAGPGIGVIAEFKRRSPSAGVLHETPDLQRILAAYERGGAVAASILTEEPNFGGSLGDLEAAREACGLALLRKDFIVDPFQIAEASRGGCGCDPADRRGAGRFRAGHADCRPPPPRASMSSSRSTTQSSSRRRSVSAPRSSESTTATCGTSPSMSGAPAG